jgi:histidinol-phosphate aminotransferase
VSDFSTILSSELADLAAYVPADAPQLPGGVVRLDANESPPPRSPAIREAVLRALEGVALERYPDARATRLRTQIAARTGAKAEEILVGCGSDEVIALLATAIARPREGSPEAIVVTPTPTFVMYRITARAHGLKPVEVPLDGAWDLDVGQMVRAVEMLRPNVIYVASPNNPTSNAMSPDRLERVVAAAKEALVVVDEAYGDFAGESRRVWRERYANLGILRTLSKIGLAALRVGWLEADAALVREIDKARQPFNVPATSQAAAAEVLERAWEAVTVHVAEVVRERVRVAAAIREMRGYEVTPSAANFLWVKTPRAAEETVARLRAQGVLVKSFHALGGRLAHQVRVTIGTPHENDRLVEGMAACV